MAQYSISRARHSGTARLLAALAAAAVLWLALWSLNEWMWPRLFGGVLHLDRAAQPWEALEFFCYDTAKILLLLAGRSS